MRLYAFLALLKPQKFPFVGEFDYCGKPNKHLNEENIRQKVQTFVEVQLAKNLLPGFTLLSN